MLDIGRYSIYTLNDISCEGTLDVVIVENYKK
jgi:hypothetical protein